MTDRRRGHRRLDIRSNDPLIRQLLEAVSASGKTDREIINRAGCSPNVLTILRDGKGSTRLVTFVALAETLGMRVKLQRGEP